MSKRKRVELSLSEKIDLIKNSDGRSCRQLADQYGIGRTQVSTILRRKDELMTAFEENAPAAKKRISTPCQYSDIDQLTWEWLKHARALKIPVSGPFVQEKAISFAASLGLTDFKGSNGWLDSFKQRHNIVWSKVSGERGDVDPEVVEEWRGKLVDLCQGYDPQDIWNMDETGLVYRAVPDRTLAVKGEECTGGKRSKERITVALACSLTGEFDTPLVIGRAAKPHCFRNLNPATQLPVSWFSNKKAWMTMGIFTTWLENFNKKMKRRKRHALLFVDNAPSHPHHLNSLSNVKVVFFPANTTSVLQPLDQGIIQTVKTQYRRRVLHKILSEIDRGVPATDLAKSVTVLDAVHWLSESVKAVKPITATKCFKKAGFEITEPVGDEDPEDDLPLAQLLTSVTSHLPADSAITKAIDYVNIDSDVPTCEALTSEWEKALVEEFKKDKETPREEAEPEEEDSVPDTPPVSLSMHEALSMTAHLRDYCLSHGLDLWQTFAKAETELLKTSLRVKVSGTQTKMDTFFKKV